MSELLTQAKEIHGGNRTDKASRDLMSNEQRDALAEDYKSRKQFLSAAHFHSDTDLRKEFERLFWESIRPKS